MAKKLLNGLSQKVKQQLVDEFKASVESKINDRLVDCHFAA